VTSQFIKDTVATWLCYATSFYFDSVPEPDSWLVLYSRAQFLRFCLGPSIRERTGEQKR
jgi:hypothetical protein